MNLKSWKVIEKVKKNRIHATLAELLMKSKLDYIKEAYIFQHPIDRNTSFLIADFFLPSRGLIVEIDGLYHNLPDQIEKDKIRDRFFIKLGYHLLRIENDDVMLFNPSEFLKYEIKPELIENEPLYGISERGGSRSREKTARIKQYKYQ